MSLATYHEWQLICHSSHRRLELEPSAFLLAQLFPSLSLGHWSCITCGLAWGVIQFRMASSAVAVTHLLTAWVWIQASHAAAMSPPGAGMFFAVWIPLQFHDLRSWLCICTARLGIVGIEQKLLLCQGFGLAPYMMKNRHRAQTA